MAKPNLVFIGIRGSVVAMDQDSGGRLWETGLKGAGFVTLLVDGNRIFAATQGEIFCLNAIEGKVLWHDPLRGYGLGLVSIATENSSSNPAVMAAENKRQEDNSAPAAVVATG